MSTLNFNSKFNLVFLFFVIGLTQILAASNLKTAQTMPYPGSYCTVNGECRHPSLTVPNSYCSNNRCVITCNMRSYCNVSGMKAPSNGGFYQCCQQKSTNLNVCTQDC